MKEIRDLFPIYTKNPDLHYFDSAASSLKLKSVADLVYEYYCFNGTNIHRGVYLLASIATNEYEKTRSMVANFINAKEDEVIFTSGTSQSLNMLASSIARTLSPGDEIISSQLEHHSSILPWIMAAKEYNLVLKYIPLNENHQITVDGFKKVLTKKTKLVAICHVANTMGYISPVKEIVKLSRDVGATVIIDAAQSVAHMPIDVKDLGVDYLAFSTHKMYGPNGVGILYGKKQLLDNLNPTSFGGEMVHIVDDKNPQWKSTPYKFETGTPAIAEVIGFQKAIEFLQSDYIPDLLEHESYLHKYALSELLEIAGIQVYNKEAQAPIILFNVDGVHPHDIASMLDANNVAVRAGHHCAQYVLAFLDQIATLRVSFGIYNNKEDVDALIKALKEAIEFFKGFE